VTRRKTRRPGEISIQPGSGIDKGHKCSCWPRPDDPCPCTPQTCDWRCRACRIHGRPFYSHGDLQYLEHGTGPLAAELKRLWRGKGTMKGGTARDAARHDGDGWRGRGEQLGWRHAMMELLPGPAGPMVGGDGWSPTRSGR
jgi:hypothetical protein